MEGADWLRTRLTSLHCATCGRSYRDGHIRVRAQRDGLSFVDFVCCACGSEANAIVTVAGRGGAARLEVGELAESPPAAWAPSLGPTDVLAMRRFLRRFDGDFQSLFGADGGADGRLGA
jgi:hypothetical protein